MWLPVSRTDIYLESWHRVCLHIEARVATLIQCPIIGFLETGHIVIYYHPRTKINAAASSHLPNF